MNFEEKQLGDLGKIITGKTPATKQTKYWNGNTPFITPKDLQKGKYIYRTERTISKLGLESLKTIVLPPKTICVSCIGNIGYVGVTTQKCVTNQQINSIIVNDDNDTNYVYYLIKNLWNLFKNYEGQSTTLSILNKTQFSKIKVKIPGKLEQKRIASTLNIIDDKIALNNKINDNLERQAQAIYKSWFVDFLPFGGTKPRTWIETDIYTLANIIYGAPFKSKQFNTDGIGIPIIRIRDLKEQQFATYTTEVHPKGYLLQPGDIVVGMDGEFRPYLWGNEEAWLNQRICVFENKRPKGKAFLYFIIKPLLQAVEETEVATTVIHIGKKDFDAFEIVLPDNETLEKFDDITAPMIEQMVSNLIENKRMVELRDAFLPKLMSGEIDVSNLQL